MENFTPWSGLAGGALIGIASTLLLAASGRIAGISGIAGGILSPVRGDTGWRVWFVAGLWTGAAIYIFSRGVPASLMASTSPLEMAGAGALVGFGTRLGAGCTSGHAVCGLARRSKRSVVATALFMSTAMATVYLVRHGLER